jgi:hypothetical protein
MAKEPLYGNEKDQNMKVCGAMERSTVKEPFSTKTAASMKEIGRTTSAMVKAK